MALKLPEQFLEGDTPPQAMWTIFLKSEYLVVLNHQTLFMILDNNTEVSPALISAWSVPLLF